MGIKKIKLFSYFKGKKQKISKNYLVSVATNTGKIRSHNEDNYYLQGKGGRIEENISFEEIQEDSCLLCAVFDGMGGESFGAESSQIAVSLLPRYLDKLQKIVNENQITEIIAEYVKEADYEIRQMIHQKKSKIGGCTMALVYLLRGMAYVFSIGDSRVYYYHEKQLKQVTEDQTLAIKKMKANIYTEEEARNSEDAHKLTCFLGVDSKNVGIPLLNYEPFPIADGKILICSDGLTDMCTSQEIADIMKRKSSSTAKLLVNQALENGGEDNVTCIVIDTVWE